MSSLRNNDPRLTRRIMTPTERRRVNFEIARNQADRTGDVEGVPRRMKGHLLNPDDKNEGLLNRRDRNLQRLLDRSEPDSLNKHERAKLEATEKELRERLSKRMVPKKSMQLRPGSLDFRKAVNRVAKEEMSQTFSRDATAWKNIKRQLDPEDPDASNLENIRPE